MSRNELCYLLDKYFEMFEAEFYHPAYLDRARRQFKQYVITSGDLDKILLGYVERQVEIITYRFHNHCHKQGKCPYDDRA